MNKRMTDEELAEARLYAANPFTRSAQDLYEEAQRARAREVELEGALRDLLAGVWDPTRGRVAKARAVLEGK